MTRQTRRRGFSLIELCAVMWALGITVSFGAVLLIATMRADQMTAGELHRISRHNQLADEFRGDVAGAKQMLARLEQVCTYGCVEEEDLRRWIVAGHEPTS